MKRAVNHALAILIALLALAAPAPAADAVPPPQGEKPILVMIHGMFVGPWCWDSFRSYFEARGYKVVTPTLRYHNIPLSSPPDPRLTETGILDYAADVEKEIRALPTKPVIIGHSMGGLIAQILASRGLAKAAVLVAPAFPRGVNPLSWTGFKSAWMNMGRWGSWKEPIRPTFEGAVYSSFHRMPEDQRKRVFEKLTYESPKAALEISFWFLDRSKATEVDESKVTCPVLTVAAGEDRLLPPSIVKKIHQKYGAVSMYREFPGRDHFIIAEPGWQEVAAYIDGWMGRLGR
ncbi:MAG: alpha/beta hydrolase [Syntrophaceae bacterium]|nr:alpha/beta hydrolase [Syntrophaceae bacterium]